MKTLVRFAILLVTFSAFAQTPGTLKWAFRGAGRIYSCPAIGRDGTIYFGSDDHKLYALDGETGVKKWEFLTGGLVREAAIDFQGTVYFGSEDGKVYAVNGQTGSKVWEFVTGGRVFFSPAVGRGDRSLYVASWDSHKVYGLDTQTGAKRWEFLASGGVYSTSIGRDESAVYMTGEEKIYALDNATGAKKWEFQTRGVIYPSVSQGKDGTLYVVNDGTLHAFDDLTGARKWGVVLSCNSSSPSIGIDGTIYVGGSDRKVHAVDGQTGTKKWEFLTGGDTDSSSPVLGADGTLYITSGEGKLHALDARTGVQAWEFAAGTVSSSPSLGLDGTVYFGDDGGKLYAIYSASKGLADSPWPKSGGDAQNTRRAKFVPHKAVATATIVNGFVVGVTLTDGGYGYDGAPPVTLEGGGGSGAAISLVMGNGFIGEIVVEDAGRGYTNAPNVLIGSPPVRSSATVAVSKVKVSLSVTLAHQYQLESSNDLKTWTATGPPFTAESETIVQEFDVLEFGRYLRLREF